MKNNLPTYWIVKRDLTNPNWRKVIEYLNETYNQDWGWTNNWYYWYDWNKSNNWTNYFYDITYFENNPTLLTIEQFMEAIKEEETFAPLEQVAVSNTGIKNAIENLKTDKYKYYYIWKKRDWKYVTEDDYWDVWIFIYIAKIPKEEKLERKIEATDSEWEEIKNILKLN